jgi:hypothetical protein
VQNANSGQHLPNFSNVTFPTFWSGSYEPQRAPVSYDPPRAPGAGQLQTTARAQLIVPAFAARWHKFHHNHVNLKCHFFIM